jgi:conjugative transposon TraK protein
MFQQLKNIDTAFKYVRFFSLAAVIVFAIVCCYTIYKSHELIRQVQQKIYVLANDKAIEAFQSERKDNIAVEARDHVKMFHHYFFTLVPDEKSIEETVTKALYLADESAKKQHDNLKENRYYSNIVAGNISQMIQMDSIQVNIGSYPFYFRYYGKQKITRSTTIVTRSLITEGYLRDLHTREDNNNHGFLIERWITLENKNLKVENR